MFSRLLALRSSQRVPQQRRAYESVVAGHEPHDCEHHAHCETDGQSSITDSGHERNRATTHIDTHDSHEDRGGSDYRLGSVTQTDLDKWTSQLAANGYAPATISKAHQLAAIVFNAAVDSDLITRTPVRSLKLPKTKRKEMRFLTGSQVSALAEATGPQYLALVRAAASTGLRWGEITGLRLQRLDLLRPTLTVTEAASEVRGHISFAEPKTTASRRSDVLPRFLCDEIAAHLATYPLNENALVFTSQHGDPLRRTNFRRRVWVPATQTTGLEGVRFHDLRHTHAAMLIAQGEHPKVIQSHLGHASITTTLNTYGHLLEGLDEAAADRLDDAWNDSSAPSPRPQGEVVPLSAP